MSFNIKMGLNWWAANQHYFKIEGDAFDPKHSGKFNHIKKDIIKSVIFEAMTEKGRDNLDRAIRALDDLNTYYSKIADYQKRTGDMTVYGNDRPIPERPDAKFTYLVTTTEDNSGIKTYHGRELKVSPESTAVDHTVIFFAHQYKTFTHLHYDRDKGLFSLDIPMERAAIGHISPHESRHITTNTGHIKHEKTGIGSITNVAIWLEGSSRCFR